MNNLFLNQKTKKAYNQITNWNEKRLNSWNFVKIFLKKNFKKNFKILDLGCGSGRDLEEAKKIGFKQKNIYGIDFSKTQIKNSKKKGFENCFVKNMTNLKFFKNDFFNIIFSTASFHHLLKKKDWEKCLNEIKRVSKIKSKILISVWNFDKQYLKKYLKRKKFEYESKDKKILKVKYTDLNQQKSFNRFYYLFEKEELKNLFQKFFKIEKISKEKNNLFFILSN